jgi:hypothetical protein
LLANFTNGAWSRPVVVLIPALLLAVPGCGESNEDKFRSDVNSICKDLDKDTAALQKAGNLKEIAREGRKAVPAITRAEKRFKDLKAPKDVRDKFGNAYAAFVRTFLETTTNFGSLIVAAEQGDQATAERLAGEIDRLDKSGDKQAKKLGFDECAKD